MAEDNTALANYAASVGITTLDIVEDIFNYQYGMGKDDAADMLKDLKFHLPISYKSLCNEYSSATMVLAAMTIKPKVREWIERNRPDASYRSVFK
jgi:hypothetical protein